MSTEVDLLKLPALLVLLLVHSLYELFLRLLLGFSWARRKLGTVQRRLVLHNETEAEYSTQQMRFEDDVIQYDVRGLDKIPSHLVVMLGPEQPDYKQLARFISWSMAAGVGHVSFYDHRGFLKRNAYLIKNFAQRQPFAKTDQIVWTHQLKKGTVPLRNGYHRLVVVSCFSPEDGKRSVVKTARAISDQLTTGSVASPSDITAELVDQRLQDQFHHIPDPELAVYFGSVCSTYGMLPWQIRLTEFLPLGARMQDVKPSHFVSCLYRFAKCEQRFGK